MTRLTFASCTHWELDKKQVTWDRIAATEPDWLLLLGDQIHMDYFPHLGAPAKMTDREFAEVMHEKYRNQFEQASFNNLIRGVTGVKPKVSLVWDDHDFGWEGCHGGIPTDDGLHIPRSKRSISRSMFLNFLMACREGKAKWPDINLDTLVTNAATAEPDDIATYHDLRWKRRLVRVIMIDSRFHRRIVKKGEGTMADILGDEQAECLQRWVLGDGGLAPRPDVAIICFSNSLTEGRDSWKKHYKKGLEEFHELCRQHGRVLVLTGDIHENSMVRHKECPQCLEVTSSGAAQMKYVVAGKRENWGLLDLNDDNTLVISIFNKMSKDEPAETWTIDADAWVPTVTRSLAARPESDHDVPLAMQKMSTLEISKALIEARGGVKKPAMPKPKPALAAPAPAPKSIAKVIKKKPEKPAPAPKKKKLPPVKKPTTAKKKKPVKVKKPAFEKTAVPRKKLLTKKVSKTATKKGAKKKK